jgi:hypothetical protein
MELWLIIVINFLIGFRPFGCPIHSVAPSIVLAHKLHHVHFHKGAPQGAAEKQSQSHGHMLSEILDQCQSAMHESLNADLDKAVLLGDSDDSAAELGIAALLAQGTPR